jgi:hypothetical protein
MNAQKPTALVIGQAIERAPELQTYQAYLNTFYWDKTSGNTPSGIVTLGETRKWKAKNNFPEKKEYPKTRIRLWGSNAHLANDLFNWMKAEEKQKGRKPSVFVQVDAQWNSYEKPNGKTGENGQAQTETVICHNGRSLIYLNNAKDLVIDIIGANYVTTTNQAQA